MASTLTPNYGWTQPNVGGDASVWGTELNNDLALIDAQVYANEQATVLIGSITMWGGATAPANWLLCQGQSLAQVGTYAALYAVIGGAFNVGTVTPGNFMLPNLQGKFPLGVTGAAAPTSGGNFSNTLAVANLPAHAHTITDVAHTHGASQPAHAHTDAGHAHSITDQQHAHGGVIQPGGQYSLGIAGGTLIGGAGGTAASGTGITGTNAAAANIQAAQPAVTVNASGTGLSTTNAAGSGAAFNVVPPYQTINFIIRYK
jgi:microcystin-dependent protein